MSKLTANAKTTKTHPIGGFCLFYAHFNAKTPPQNAPFLALLQRNAKTKTTNYNNINTLNFCILQFTFVLHPLVFLLLFFYSIKHDICVPMPQKLFLMFLCQKNATHRSLLKTQKICGHLSRIGVICVP